MTSALALPDTPARRAVWSLHLSRQLSYALYGRFVSAGNETYIDECLTALRELRKTPAVSRNVNVRATFDAVLERPTHDGLRRLLQSIDDTGYMRAASQPAPRPLPFGSLRAKRYARLLFVLGPGIGLGDEIAFAPFLRGLRSAFPEAKVEIYTSYPSLWRELAPDAITRNQVRRPDRAYARIEEIAAAGEGATTLAGFVTYGNLEMLLPYFAARVPVDVFQYPIGQGYLDLLPAGSAAAQRLTTLDPAAPSIARARDALLHHLLGTRAGHPPPDCPSAVRDREQFVLVVNPLTSKAMPVDPPAWAALVGAVRRAIARSRRLDVRVYQGLSPSAHGIAARTVESCRAALRPGDTIAFLTDRAADLTSANSVHITAGALRDADLLLGMDTFTAHLAAETNTPSVALCLTRNPLFWEPHPSSFWLDLGAGGDAVAHLLVCVTALLAGRGDDLARGIPEGTFRAAAAASGLATLPSALELFSSGVRDAIAALDTVWLALPPRVQAMFARLDAAYAWPHIRARFDPKLPLAEVRRAGAQLRDSMFFRLVGMAGR